MTGQKTPGKYGIAVTGFADRQRGTTNPKEGPFSPTQDVSAVKTATEHAEQEFLKGLNRIPEGDSEALRAYMEQWGYAPT